MIKPSREQIILTTIGKRIRRVRQMRGFSQEDMAGHIERSRQTVIYIENGKNSLSVRTLIHISSFLRIRIENWFMNQREWNSFYFQLENKFPIKPDHEYQENGDA